VEKYAEAHYQSFNEKDLIKFLIISHIPNLYFDCNIENQRPHGTNVFLNKLYANYSKIELNKDIHIFIEENIENISKFVFSDLGLFNKSNKIISNSCVCLLTRIFENKTTKYEQISQYLIKSSFGKLNVDKLKFIDNLVSFYSKQVDYISFYDLIYLVDNLKNLEKNYSDSFKTDSSKELVTAPATNTTSISQASTSSKGQAKGKKGQAQPQKAEKIDKDAKTIELKAYLEEYLNNLIIHSNFLITRHNPVLELLLTDDYSQKENTKFALRKLWSMLKSKIVNANVKSILYEFFKRNQITKKFAFEFSNLMNLQANHNNHELFSQTLEASPSLVIHFNERLEQLMSDPNSTKTVQQLFEHFDFIVIKLLFYIILNHHISNEDKTSSVNILIKIIETLSQNLLNFNDISLLVVSLLKSSYNHDNLSTLLEIFLRRSKDENFLTLCDDILEYEYVAKITFLTQIIKLDKSTIRRYKNFCYKIWILLFDENDNISQLAKDVWNKYNLVLDSNFVLSNEFAIAFTEHRLKDNVHRAIRGYSFIVPSEVKTILEKYKEFYEKELIESKLEVDEEEEETEKKKNRIILLDYVNDTIELLSSNDKQSLLDFLMSVSDKEFEEELFDMINKSIFSIIKSIKDEGLIENILSSIEKNLKNISTRNLSEINNNNLKIILMMLHSILISTINNKKVLAQKELLYSSLQSLAVKLNNSEVLCLISSCFEYLSIGNEKKSEELLKSILQSFQSLGSKLLNAGEIYILAGLIRCFGINIYKINQIDVLILENMKKNKSNFLSSKKTVRQ